MRISEIFANKNFIFFPFNGKTPPIETKLIEQNELKQGALRTSYLLSSISALAERTERITKLFQEDKINNYGVYCIKLCKDGEWREIVIDDFLPCDPKKRDLCFSSCSRISKDSKSSSHPIWLPLLEKAYAKAYGSYHLIEEGSTETALTDLTGAPVESIDNSNEELWDNLKSAFENDYVIIASAGETSASRELLKEVGLIPFNSYTILEAHEVEIEEDVVEYLIKVRNPWGVTEWIGDWSSYSNLWRDDIKNKLSFNYDKDSTFWMNFRDFKHYFSKVEICKVQTNYVYDSIRLYQKKRGTQYNLVQLTVSPSEELETIHIFLSLIQPDARNYPNSGYKYSIGRFIISKLSGAELTYIEGCMDQEKYITKEMHLAPGEYLVYVEIDWNTDRDYPFVLGCYSMVHTSMKTLSPDDFPQILDQIYISAAKSANSLQDFASEGASNCFKCSKITPEGYAYIYFENNEEDSTLIEDVKYTKFEGLRLLPPFEGTSYCVKVEPMQRKIVLIKRLNVSEFNLYYSFQ